MKLLLSSTTGIFLLCGLLQADENKTTIRKSTNVQKSVTVTSDGNQTIKKTTITENGKTRTITEITDADGNTQIVEEGDASIEKKAPDEQKESTVWLGLKPAKASAVLKGQLGLKENEGLVVEVVAPDGPAAKAGIQVNDLLLSMDEKALGTPEELEANLRIKKSDEKANFGVMRKGERKTIEITLENRPKNQQTNTKKKIQRRTHTGGTFDEILSDPNIPESFKKTVREMQRRQKEFREKHKID